MHRWILLVALSVLAGCSTTATLPLCPKLAQASYATLEMGHDQIVGRFVKEAANDRGITIAPLSYFVAEFKGSRRDIKWLRQNYPLLVTGFNPRLVTEDEKVYLSAHHHVQSWISRVEKGNYEALMLSDTNYCPACCSTPNLMRLNAAH